MKKFLVELRMTVSKVVIMHAADEEDAADHAELMVGQFHDRELLGIGEVCVVGSTVLMVKQGGEEFAVLDGTLEVEEVRTVEGTAYDE